MRTLLVCIGAVLLIAADRPLIPCPLREATTPGGAIGYRDCGRGDPVMIIPGGPGLDAAYVDGLARMVTASGHRAIVIEPRGTGASRAAIGDGSRLTVAGSVADVEAVRAAAGIGRITILGHSFGGAVAQAYAAAHPDHVAALMLMDSVGPEMKSAVQLDGWRRRLTPDDLARYDAARAGGDRIAAMKIKFRASFYHPARGTAFIDSLTNDRIHLDVMRLSDSYQRDYRIALATARFPVMILAGDIDWIRGNEPALTATYPRARLMVIPHAGHFPWVDAPAATRRILDRALRRPLDAGIRKKGRNGEPLRP
ncbi:MAG: alpha/beta hydrolase [Sphingomonas sp.]|uniref:alpha/beta hydrolase n=1 Tax=Sphingomonas sp. TaxID=28214 RepID=UPI003F7DAE90